MNDQRTTYCLTVKGKVQGVFFRVSTKNEAERLDLKGSVKNLPNGDVYVELQGDEIALQLMMDWIKKGPDMARVDDIETQTIKKEAFRKFEIVR